MSKPYKEVCGNCYFAVPLPKSPDEPRRFACHRFPPHPSNEDEFPLMNECEWCGEWSPSQEVKGVDWD